MLHTMIRRDRETCNHTSSRRAEHSKHGDTERTESRSSPVASPRISYRARPMDLCGKGKADPVEEVHPDCRNGTVSRRNPIHSEAHIDHSGKGKADPVTAMSDVESKSMRVPVNVPSHCRYARCRSVTSKVTSPLNQLIITAREDWTLGKEYCGQDTGRGCGRKLEGIGAPGGGPDSKRHPFIMHYT